jgi:hypothetical protein
MHIITASNITLQVDGIADGQSADWQVRQLLQSINDSISRGDGSPAFAVDGHLDIAVVLKEDGDEDTGTLLPYSPPLPFEHKTYPRSMWKGRVAADETVLGYWTWVEAQNTIHV